jgi:flavin reductase (DIM6/NTAB) family NADH-FMN oxidoreductase RutF
MSFTPLDFRHTMGHFATGINVVTTVLDGTLYGITVNAFCSVSLTPPQVLICIDKTANTHDILQKSGVYAVNMLDESQKNLSERFARRDTEGGKTFADIDYYTAETGCPIFSNALARMECKIVAQYEGGDHTIFLGEVLNLSYQDSETKEALPLLYYRSNYRSLTE